MNGKKVGSFFKSLLPLIIFVVVQLVVAVVLTTVKVTQFTLAHMGDDEAILQYSIELATDTGFLMNVMLVFEVIIAIIFAIIYFAGMKSSFKTIKGHFTAKTVPGIVVMFMGVEAAVGALLVFISTVAPSALENYEQMMQQSGLGELSLASTILTLVCAPIVEEIAFRGITMKWAKGFSSNFLVINIFQAALFGIAHMNLVQGIYAFVLGLLLGYVAHKYQSLWASIIGHLVFNFTGTYLVAVLFGTSETPSVVRAIIVFVCAVSIACAGFFALINKDPNVAEPKNALEEVKEEVEETVEEA